jgi:myo-inositol 2-dehydrogenase/D-chiro-inositol 1-dehydrogenase
MTCIRFALLGSGFIGQVHAASLARHERTVLAMVADADPERAKALASRYGARAVTVAEAINSDAIDAVLIASSTPSHAALLEAAARGKAVYCEKPIDLSLARARQVVEKVLPLGVPVTVGFNRRFDASHQQLRRRSRRARLAKSNWFRWCVGHRLCRRWNICAAPAARCATRRFTSLTCCAFLPAMK